MTTAKVLITETDRKIINQAATLADAHTLTGMRDFLESIDSEFAASLDYGTLAAACLGVAQHHLRVMAELLKDTADA